MNFEERTMSSETIFKGRIITLKQDTVILPNGTEHTRELVEHPGGVGVVAITENGGILLVRQWRYPFSKVVTEIPAGKRDPGEAPEHTARRELEEETGFQAGELVRLGEIMSSPGFCNEVIHLYLATKLRSTAQCPDEDEFVEVFEMPFDEVCQKIECGELTDAKTVAGILLARLKRTNEC